MLASAGFVFAAALPAAAQDPSPEKVKALIAQVMGQQGGTAQTPMSQVFTTPGPRVDLTLTDAVSRAVEKNIDIAVARITPRLSDFSLAALDANYRINLTSATSNNRTTSLPSNTVNGITQPSTSNRQAWSAGISQNIWKGGGNYTLNWTNSRFDNPQSSTNFRNPQLSSGLVFNGVQPLMRGFRTDTTRTSIGTTRLSQSNDEIALTSTTITTQSNIKNAYWDLVYAIQAIEAAQNSFDIAQRLVQDNKAKVEIGTMAPIEIISAEAEQANRRQTLVLAQATQRTSELALKRLIVSGTDDPLWASSINPVDRPPSAPEPINLEAAVARALSQRTDLQQSKNNLQISDLNLINQVDQTRPQLNLTVNYGLTGLGGTILKRSTPDPITGAVVNQTIPSGYLDALQNIAKLDAPNWTIGASFAYPLGSSAQQATVARSKLSLKQTEANLKALELQIATDVTNAYLTVQSSLESVQTTAVARDLAQKRLEAAQTKFDNGMAINYEVVQAQRDFFDARNAELRAILNYRKALVNFEAVQSVGTRGVAAVGGGGG
jgi:outer membrane protein